MKNKRQSTDPETTAITRALRRASDRAMRLSKTTGTPFWVMKNGDGQLQPQRQKTPQER
jgi:hypothetical protein